MDSESAWLQLLALGDQPEVVFDDDAAGTLVHLLQQRGEAVVLEWALPVLSDPDPWRRQAAAWVLGELGYEQGHPFTDRVMPALARALRVERDLETRQDLIAAFGHANDPAWVPELLLYAGDRDPLVRASVAGAVPIMFGSQDMSAEAVVALITLSGDTDPGVRDWATFSLGTQSALDSDEIRKALAQRLEDDGGDTRFEATLGLARRGDDRALAAIQRRLDDDRATIYSLDLDAAAELADPSLLAALGRLRTRWATEEDPDTEALHYAIDRCQPATHLLAALAETTLTDAVNSSLLNIGWSIRIQGDYPMTVLTVHRPDGSVDSALAGTRLWEGISPTAFEVDQQITRWTNAVREIEVAANAS